MDKKGILEQYYKEEFDTWVKRIKSRKLSEMDAEDIVQESYYRALKYIKSFNPDLASVNVWFGNIINNVHRDMKRDVLASVEVREDDLFTKEADEYEYDEQLVELIESRISRVKLPNSRSILYLSLIAGTKVGDISRQLDTPLVTVKMTIQRFKKKLREDMDAGGSV